MIYITLTPVNVSKVNYYTSLPLKEKHKKCEQKYITMQTSPKINKKDRLKID